MSSFFEKLKKGMGIEAPIEKEISQPEVKERTPEKPKKRKVEQKKKLEIKEIPLEIEEKIEKPKKEVPVKEEAALEEKVAQKEEKIEVKKEDWFKAEGQLSVDVYETNEELIVQSAIAGIKAEDLEISIENDVIAIRGVREKPSPEEKGSYFYQECYWGPFSREIIAPTEIDSSRAQANLKNGVLTLRIPKIEKEKKRKITVKME